MHDHQVKKKGEMRIFGLSKRLGNKMKKTDNFIKKGHIHPDRKIIMMEGNSLLDKCKQTSICAEKYLCLADFVGQDKN